MLAVTQVELVPRISLCWDLGPQRSVVETMGVFWGGRHASVKYSRES